MRSSSIKWRETQAALHKPDQVAGGNYLKIGSMAEGIVKMHLINLLIQTI
ncbi:polymorphic toxin type 15 domain-containing protein [Bacillus paranthracis]